MPQQHFVHKSRNKLDRQTQVAALRLSGVTDQAAIAATFGVNQSTISRDFAELDVRFRERADEQIAEAKGIDLQRLDAMIKGLWKKATNGDTWAVDRVIKCLERRASLLGMDAPKKVESTGKGGGPIRHEVAGPDLSSVLTLEQRFSLDHILAAAEDAGR